MFDTHQNLGNSRRRFQDYLLSPVFSIFCVHFITCMPQKQRLIFSNRIRCFRIRLETPYNMSGSPAAILRLTRVKSLPLPLFKALARAAILLLPERNNAFDLWTMRMLMPNFDDMKNLGEGARLLLNHVASKGTNSHKFKYHFKICLRVLN